MARSWKIYLDKKLVIAALVSSLFLVLCLAYFSDSQIEVLLPKRRSVKHFVYGNGVIESVKSFKIASSYGGYIAQLDVDSGDIVEKGAVLAHIRDSSKLAQLKQQEAKFKYLAEKLQRTKELYKEKVISASEYDLVSSEYKQAEALYKQAGDELKDHHLVAEQELVILEKYMELGEFAQAGAPILLVGVPEPIRVAAEIAEDDILVVKKGNLALISIGVGNSQLYETKVAKLLPYIDNKTNKFKVYIDLPAGTKLPYGLSVKVNILARENKDALIVPIKAVFNNKVQVFENGIIKERAVKLGIRNYDIAEIIDGISEQEYIVIPYNNQLKSDEIYHKKLVKF